MRSIRAATEALSEHSYPATTDALVEAYGDLVLEHPSGTETLGEALSRVGPETYESADDAQLATMSAVGAGAIGRKGYSDRDPVPIGGDGPDQVSF